jgi:hypothetical protein
MQPPPKRYIVAAILAASAVFAIKAGSAALEAATQYRLAQDAALCATDSECAELCPADDVECDGGPQS